MPASLNHSRLDSDNVALGHLVICDRGKLCGIRNPSIDAWDSDTFKVDMDGKQSMAAVPIRLRILSRLLSLSLLVGRNSSVCASSMN
jgi:hypothetical protein